MRLRICLRQHGGCRLLQDLRPRQIRGFLGKVSVSDGAFGGRRIFAGDAEVVDGRRQRVLLERAQSATQRADLRDGLVDDLLRRRKVVAGQRVDAAAGQAAEEAQVVVAKAAGGDVLNTDAGQTLGVDFRAEGERCAASGDAEGLGLTGIESGAELEVDIQIAVAVADVGSFDFGGGAVDVDDRVGSVGLAAMSAGDGKRSGDRRNADVVGRSVIGSLEIDLAIRWPTR